MFKKVPTYLIVLAVTVFFALVVLVFRASAVSAGDPNVVQIKQLEQQVKSIKTEISQLESQQTQTIKERENTLMQLRQLEISMGKLNQNLNVDTQTLYNLENNASDLKKN